MSCQFCQRYEREHSRSGVCGTPALLAQLDFNLLQFFDFEFVVLELIHRMRTALTIVPLIVIQAWGVGADTTRL